MGTSLAMVRFPGIFDDDVLDIAGELTPDDKWAETRAARARGKHPSDQWKGVVLLYEIHARHGWVPNRQLVQLEFRLAKQSKDLWLQEWRDPDEAWRRISCMTAEMLIKARRRSRHPRTAAGTTPQPPPPDSETGPA